VLALRRNRSLAATLTLAAVGPFQRPRVQQALHTADIEEVARTER
jgi:hypothetical protein